MSFILKIVPFKLPDMLASLKDHPFAVEAFFESSTVLTFAVPKASLEKLIPPCLELDTYQDKWGFVAVAMVQTKDLRPKGLPKMIGNDFFLIGYRIFVKYINNKGKCLRGLYILKSETDKRKMQFFGNIFTHYNYTTTDIQRSTTNDTTEISSVTSDFKLVLKYKEDASLPKHSPFEEWKQARRYAGPLPFTFTYNEVNKNVTIIEGVRQNWKPTPVEAQSYHFSYIDSLNLEGVVLANAFIIKDIPYYWKKGIKETWAQ